MLHLTELEEKLAQPDGHALQQQMLVQLQGTALRLRQQLAAGVPRAEYDAYHKSIEAVQAAAEVLQAWPTPSPVGSNLAHVSVLFNPVGNPNLSADFPAAFAKTT